MATPVRRLRVTILSDNSVAGSGALAEHGFSLYVEADGHRFLFDTGSSALVLGNAARLGLDLTPASQVVLSHGHYDHTGGLAPLLEAYGHRELIGHPDLFGKRYARPRTGRPRSIGLPEGRRRLAARGATFRLAAAPQEISPGVSTTGPIARTTGFEEIPRHFAISAGGRLRQDSFEDEQAVVIGTREGLVVLLGCSHRGLVNTLRHAMELAGEDRLRAAIGGTHLGPAGPAQLARTIEELRSLDVGTLVACHCTGFAAAAELRAALGERVEPGGVGYRFQI